MNYSRTKRACDTDTISPCPYQTTQSAHYRVVPISTQHSCPRHGSPNSDMPPSLPSTIALAPAFVLSLTGAAQCVRIHLQRLRILDSLLHLCFESLRLSMPVVTFGLSRSCNAAPAVTFSLRRFCGLPTYFCVMPGRSFLDFEPTQFGPQLLNDRLNAGCSLHLARVVQEPRGLDRSLGLFVRLVWNSCFNFTPGPLRNLLMSLGGGGRSQCALGEFGCGAAGLRLRNGSSRRGRDFRPLQLKVGIVRGESLEFPDIRRDEVVVS